MRAEMIGIAGRPPAADMVLMPKTARDRNDIAAALEEGNDLRPINFP
jgi:hypothetical protein